MLTSLKRQWIPRICSWVPPNWWHRFVGIELILPHWHLASDEDVPHVRGLYQYRTLQQFKADLEYFLKYYSPVSMQDVIDHLDGIRALPRRCFFPTFDDGFREIHDVIAPLLKATGVPAGFFLITSAIDNGALCYPQKKSLLIRALQSQAGSAAEKEASQILSRAKLPGSSLCSQIASIHYGHRPVLDELATVLGCDFPAYLRSVQPYLTSAQVGDLMRSGFAIGSHSVDHPVYSDLSLADQLGQTRQSMQWLSQRFGYRCESFASPYRDMKISPEFFPKAFELCGLKVSFTLDRLGRHFFPRNLVRFSMERSELPAAQIVARQYVRAVLHPTS